MKMFRGKMSFYPGAKAPGNVNLASPLPVRAVSNRKIARIIIQGIQYSFNAPTRIMQINK
jgi:hypothetical protein